MVETKEEPITSVEELIERGRGTKVTTSFNHLPNIQMAYEGKIGDEHSFLYEDTGGELISYRVVTGKLMNIDDVFTADFGVPKKIPYTTSDDNYHEKLNFFRSARK